MLNSLIGKRKSFKITLGHFNVLQYFHLLYIRLKNLYSLDYDFLLPVEEPNRSDVGKYMFGINLKQNSFGIWTMAALFSKPFFDCERISMRTPMVLEHLFRIAAGSLTLLCLDFFFSGLLSLGEGNSTLATHIKLWVYLT